MATKTSSEWQILITFIIRHYSAELFEHSRDGQADSNRQFRKNTILPRDVWSTNAESEDCQRLTDGGGMQQLFVLRAVAMPSQPELSHLTCTS